MRGPGIFLAQFQGDQPPFSTLDGLAGWAAELGFTGVQLPTLSGLIDLALAAESDTYCQELVGRLAERGVVLTELSAHLQGQLVAVHPAYDALFDGFAPAYLRGDPAGRQEWAVAEMGLAARAARRLGLRTVAAFSGGLAWPYFYPWPQRPPGLIEEAFAELARRWRPILDGFDEQGIDCAFELHPGEDLHDGASYERFLAATGEHGRANLLYDPSHFLLQDMDYLGFIDRYHERIRAFHVKDAERRRDARSGVYGGYQPWVARSGRFRSAGDGAVDFRGIFSRFAEYGYDGWAVLEWECPLKHPEDGAREGAAFIRAHMIRPAPRAFDDFAAPSGLAVRAVLGIDRE